MHDTAIVIQDALRMGPVDNARHEARTTLDMRAQRAADRKVDLVLDRIEPQLAHDLCFGATCETRADYLIAAAEIDGDALPLRVVLTNRHQMLFGPYRRTLDGTLERLPPAFGLGSQHKIPLVLVAARHREWQLCNRHFEDIRNTSGPVPVEACDHRRPAGWVATREALGRSMNLPWIDLAARHFDDVMALETGLGFLGRPAGPGGAAMGVGRVAPPERFMALLAAIERAGRGAAPRTEGLSLLEGAPQFAVDLDALGYPRALAATAAALLSAPLKGPVGTLRLLSTQIRDTGCDVTIGKTGTGEVESGAARARTATVAVACGIRRYVVFVSVSSGHGGTPLGNVGARDLGQLIAAALHGLREAR